VPTLKTYAEDITMYYTFVSLFSGDNQNDNEWVDRYQVALDGLDDIKNGDCDLFDSTNNLIPERTEDAGDNRVDSNTKNYVPTFGEDDPLDWKVDSSKLDDLSNERN